MNFIHQIPKMILLRIIQSKDIYTTVPYPECSKFGKSELQQKKKKYYEHHTAYPHPKKKKKNCLQLMRKTHISY